MGDLENRNQWDKLEIVESYYKYPPLELIDELDEGGYSKEFLREFLEEGNVVARGTEADIYRHSAREFKNICLKRNARTTERAIYNKGLLSEERRQYEACKIMENAQENDSNTEYASIPKPFMALKAGDSSEYFVAMEYIKGKTLWRVLLEEVISNTSDDELEGRKRDHLLDMEDDDLSEQVIQIFRLGNIEDETMRFRKLESKLRGRKFVPKDVYNRLKNSINALNRNGFYHRDLHPKNVMLDDKKTWIIDFGYSYNKETSDEKLYDPYEDYQIGQELKFSRDEGVLQLLEDYVIESDEDKEKKANELVKKERIRVGGLLKQLTRQRSGVQGIVDSNDYSDAKSFISAFTSDPKFRVVMIGAIAEGSIDKVSRYAKILAILETERFGSARETYKYLEENITKYHNLTLLNKVLSSLEPLKLNFK